MQPHDTTSHPANEIPYGYCHCGCGGRAPIAKTTDPKRGYIKGLPKRYIAGHRNSRGGPVARFWRQVDKRGPDECWPWLGNIVGGYGTIMVDGKNVKAHRFSYELHYGPIPDCMIVCHSCDQPACQNPAHLWPGTKADNNADRDTKNRHVNCPGERNGLSKLTENTVQEVRRRWANGESYAALGQEYGVTKQAIYCVVKRKTWNHIP